MTERNVLIGNGINIAISKNNDYKNYSIINRLTKFLSTDKYDDVFQNGITSAELQTILNQLNGFFNDMLKGISAFRLTQNEDEITTLFDIAQRYHSKSTDLISVGIEDYFFVMKMIFNKFGDESTPIKALYDGLKILFLDAIYNNGKIEELYIQMVAYAKELRQYSKIFTVNYDTNLDKISDKPIYHLHGSFNVLDDTFRPETIIGYLEQKKPNPAKVIFGKEHLYCNAIMAFSGHSKLEIIEAYSNINRALDSVVARLKNPMDLEVHQWYEKLKVSTAENDIVSFQSIGARLEHPELKDTEYPIAELRSACGILDIIGMSPNNDNHIFGIINNNPNIAQVIYFSASDEDTKASQRIIKKPLQIRNVFKYWKSIGL